MRRDYRQLIIVLLIVSIIASLILTINRSRDSPTDINKASKEELVSLPGIGEVLAQRIIDNRPYRNIYELDSVKGIGPKTMEKIRGKLVVK